MRLRFVLSATEVGQLPDSPAEVAVVGRSNVGKSSLINAIGGSDKLARVSKTPGRTQHLNLFELDGGATLVDLPGYGYASAPTRQRNQWQKMAERYLLEREHLELTHVQVDGEVGPKEHDQQMRECLDANGLAYTVAATKHDKVKPSQRDKRKKILAESCGPDVVWVSAHKNVNIDRLRALIAEWLT
jgi:GTP-binding protein